jgi:hypothetical protein
MGRWLNGTELPFHAFASFLTSARFNRDDADLSASSTNGERHRRIVIESTRDLILPEDREGFPVIKIGVAIDSDAAPLGFGAAANITVENTDAGFDPATGQGTITDHLYLTEAY